MVRREVVSGVQVRYCENNRLQEGALKLYTEQIWPDMVGRHQSSSGAGSRRGEAPTVHAQAAKHLSKRLVEVAGSDGSKLKRSNLG